MFFLFSGEGPTDLGTCIHPDMINTEENYLHGPLTVVVDQIVEQRHSYSLLDYSGAFGFVPGTMLGEHAKTLRPRPKSGNIPGLRIKKETRFFYRNARALAQIALCYGNKIREKEVVAILFRDGETPDDHDRWRDKMNSMLDGFRDENFHRGVAMIPASVSEAWMLCGLYKQRNPHHDCHFLETEPYGDGSRHKLKNLLEKELGETPDRETLCKKVKLGEINFSLVNLNCFEEFKDRLEKVISSEQE